MCGCHTVTTVHMIDNRNMGQLENKGCPFSHDLPDRTEIQPPYKEDTHPPPESAPFSPMELLAGSTHTTNLDI